MNSFLPIRRILMSVGNGDCLRNLIWVIASPIIGEHAKHFIPPASQREPHAFYFCRLFSVDIRIFTSRVITLLTLRQCIYITFTARQLRGKTTEFVMKIGIGILHGAWSSHQKALRANTPALQPGK